MCADAVVVLIVAEVARPMGPAVSTAAAPAVVAVLSIVDVEAFDPHVVLGDVL